MKYIKTFENNKGDKLEFKKFDIIFKYGNMDKEIYLVLKDCYLYDKWINVIKIATIQRNFEGKLYATLTIDNYDKNIRIKILNQYLFIKLISDEDLELLFDHIDKDNEYIKKELNILKTTTNFDLKNSEIYKKHLIKKDAEKYNL